MQFQHTKYPDARIKVTAKDEVKTVKFRGGFAETKDQDIQKALKANPNVEEVKEEKKDD